MSLRNGNATMRGNAARVQCERDDCRWVTYRKRGGRTYEDAESVAPYGRCVKCQGKMVFGGTRRHHVGRPQG